MVGRRIKLLREERKMSQAELAAALSCSRMTINNYETEKRVPDMDFALSVASFFGVTVEYLSGRTEFRDSDDIEVSVQRAEQLMEITQKLPQGETQRLLFYFTKALEKALETGLEDAAISALSACSVQLRRLMLAYEVAQKASFVQMQELLIRNVPHATVRSIAKDKNTALSQNIFETAKEFSTAAELFGSEMQKKQDLELEKILD
ncbi:MAG TPA: helix-turn-helix transcriptional regulator [Clostridia bacterium]|nr:helix-turn-helix transcriptional regulator [Clostridia bacterium]